MNDQAEKLRNIVKNLKRIIIQVNAESKKAARSLLLQAVKVESED